MLSWRWPFGRLRFRSKLGWGMAAIVLVFGLLLGHLLTDMAAHSLLEQHHKLGKTVARNLARRAAEPLLATDLLRLENMVDEVTARTENAEYAFVVDAAHQVLAHSFERGFPVELIAANMPEDNRSHRQLLRSQPGLIDDFAAPVLIEGDRIGWVRVGVSRGAVSKTYTRLWMVGLGLTLAAIAFGLVLVSLFARTVARRLARLRDCAEEIVKGNLDVVSSEDNRVNCWEIMDCQMGNCPAYGEKRLRCWYQAGTLCPQCGPGGYPDKLSSCRHCPVYRRCAGDELQELAEAFDVMAATLKDYLGQIQTARQDMARQRQLLRTILDVTPDLVSLQDVNLVYQAANKAFCKYFNLEEKDIVGRTDFDIFSEAQADQNYHEDKQILVTGEALSKEIAVAGERNRRWFHILKVPVYDRDRITGLLLTARDITVVKQYQEQLVHSQKMEDLGRLAGGIAHEINTPLGIILGYTQLLLEDFEEGTQSRTDLETIEKQARICRKLVADLLGFSRQSGFTRAEMELNDSIREVISLVEHTFSLNKVWIRSDFDANIPPIEADKERLKQVWMNLFNNAFDAIGEDGFIFVRTKLCAHRRRVVVTVADTGPGIGEDDLDKIFDPFFSTKPVGKGTGLGLSVTFGIIKDHGGRINALSPAPNEYMPSEMEEQIQIGAGTVFIIELPVVDDVLPEDECEEATRHVVRSEQSSA